MSTIIPTRVPVEKHASVALVTTWAALANGDDGAPVELSFLSDRSVQVVGTFGVGGNVLIEGSNNGVDYATLTDPQGNTLSLASGRIESVMEVVRFIRPRVTAGDGTTSLTVTLLMVGSV